MRYRRSRPKCCGSNLNLRDPVRRVLHKALASPYTHDAHPLVIDTVDDAERRMDEFPKPRNLELGHDSTAVREVRELVDLRHDRSNRAIADLGGEV